MASVKTPMLLVDLPLTDYATALAIQERIVERKTAHGGPDVLIMLEHPHTVSLGKRGSRSDLLTSAGNLTARGISLHVTDRGGAATYHGPGQVVCYPILSLKSYGLRPSQYVRRLEDTIIMALASFGIPAVRQPRLTGVWTDTRDKIASIGVRIKRGVAYHGFSLNVNLALDPGELIILCGMPQARMVSLSSFLKRHVDSAQVRRTIARSFSDVFEVSLEPSGLEDTCEI